MNSKILTPDLLKTKQHFEILDGLRGIAAVSVVLFHFMEVVYSDYSKNFIGHGFLAVDFFFCLSGFVIGYAYDDRIGKIGMRSFFRSRFIRLHPLVIIGSILGLLGFLLDPFSSHQVVYSAGRILLIFLFSIFLVPFPVMPDRYFNLFSFNAPAWSLYLEYVANILYAFILSRLNRRIILLLAIVAAAALCFVSHRAGNLMGGWSKDTAWDGVARLSYSFLAGLLVYRYDWIIRSKLGFAGMSILLFLAFVMPYFSWNWLAEVLVVLLYFPLMIALGAGARLSEGVKRVCVLLGNISYPLYMTHYALIWVFANYYNLNKPGSGRLFCIISISTILMFGFAYCVMKYLDMPVRKYLSEKWKKG